MAHTDIRRCALITAALLTLGPALYARQSNAPTVQYKSPEGVEYRALPDTDAVRGARAALEADPKDLARIVDLGVAAVGQVVRRMARFRFHPVGSGTATSGVSGGGI